MNETQLHTQYSKFQLICQLPGNPYIIAPLTSLHRPQTLKVKTERAEKGILSAGVIAEGNSSSVPPKTKAKYICQFTVQGYKDIYCHRHMVTRV